MFMPFLRDLHGRPGGLRRAKPLSRGSYAMHLDNDSVDGGDLEGGTSAAVTEVEVPTVIAAVLHRANLTAEPPQNLSKRRGHRAARLRIVIVDLVVGHVAAELEVRAKGGMPIARPSLR